MTVRHAPLLLLLGLFTLVGCRDALVDEQLQLDDLPSAPAPVENSIYVKGPGSLGVGMSGNFRAEPVRGAVQYDWAQDSVDRGQVGGGPTDPTRRLFELTGVRAGTVRITVSALDASNRVLGVGTRTIFVGQ